MESCVNSLRDESLSSSKTKSSENATASAAVAASTAASEQASPLFPLFPGIPGIIKPTPISSSPSPSSQVENESQQDHEESLSRKRKEREDSTLIAPTDAAILLMNETIKLNEENRRRIRSERQGESSKKGRGQGETASQSAKPVAPLSSPSAGIGFHVSEAGLQIMYMYRNYYHDLNLRFPPSLKLNGKRVFISERISTDAAHTVPAKMSLLTNTDLVVDIIARNPITKEIGFQCSKCAEYSKQKQIARGPRQKDHALLHCSAQQKNTALSIENDSLKLRLRACCSSKHCGAAQYLEVVVEIALAKKPKEKNILARSLFHCDFKLWKKGILPVLPIDIDIFPVPGEK